MTLNETAKAKTMKMLNNGKTQVEVAKTLAKMGYKTAKGGKVTQSVVSKMKLGKLTMPTPKTKTTKTTTKRTVAKPAMGKTKQNKTH
jgi:hypothetical protein